MALKSPVINVMEAAARKAARGLVRDFGEVENLQVSRKGPADFVSIADQRAEQVLRYELNRARPDFGFLLEEGGEIAGKDKRVRWIVDPLDGTTNFLHGIPHFAISIGLEREGELAAGVILDPVKDELFWAEKNYGSYLNGRRLRVSSRGHLPDALIATGIPFRGCDGFERFEREVGRVMPEVAGIRRFGAAALDLAYVAAGRYDGFWEHGLKAWDIAAGILLVREAGGSVTEIGGRGDPYASGDVLATNGNLHESLGTLLRGDT